MYHFIGIKGSGMSALAQIMKKLGFEVEGSDVSKELFTEINLKKLNIKVKPFSKNNIKKGMIVIYGTTFKNHEELKEAKKLGLENYSYPEMLGKLTQTMKTICISGTHGKTTTTTILANVLNKLNKVNYLIGDGTGYASKKNELFVLEACEYERHFLFFEPYDLIITNIELDHVDYYKDIDDLINAFNELVSKTKNTIVTCGDDLNIQKLKSTKIKYYGLNKSNDVYVDNIIYNSKTTSFDVYINNNYYDSYILNIYAEYMVLNVLAIISYCYYNNYDKEELKKALTKIELPKRRFSERLIKTNIIVDDYAHHPTEIKAIIEACRQKYNNKLIAILEPHTFSRVKQFHKEIAQNLIADEVYILDIYPSREKQEDFKYTTSDLILNHNPSFKKITKDNVSMFKNYTNTTFLFMSPNDLNEMIEKVINVL